MLGVLVANASLTGAAEGLIHELVGSAKLQLAARSQYGFDESLLAGSRELPGVTVAVPLLRENVTVVGPRGRRSVQLLGVTPAVLRLGSFGTGSLGVTGFSFGRGLILPASVAEAVGVEPNAGVTVLALGRASTIPLNAVLRGPPFGSLATSPVAVASLATAQDVTGLQGRLTQILVATRPGQQRIVSSELGTLSAGRLNVLPADNELRLLAEAIKPNDQSTTLFAAISVMVGFLLALNAMLLTVPERRRFVADLRLQGYDWRQVLVLLSFQAIILGIVASAVGVTLGDLLSHSYLHHVPQYLTTAFPIGSQQTLHLETILLAVACGVVAAMLASLSPALDLRPGRSTDAIFRDHAGGAEALEQNTPAKLAIASVTLLALITLVVLIVPGLTIEGGMALAVAVLLAIPSLFVGIARVLQWAGERVASSSLIVVVSELRAVTTRSVALAGIAALAVYGSVAVGGAQHDLLHGLDEAIVQQWSTAQDWVTPDGNIFDADGFRVNPSTLAALRRAPGIASVRIHQGGFLDVDNHRLWIRALPAGASTIVLSSQLLQGNVARANELLRAGGWATVSSGFASEHHLQLGSSFSLSTPSGPVRFGIAAITTNIGWPSGTITLNTRDYSRYWQTTIPTTLAVELKPGVSSANGRQIVKHLLGPGSVLRVQTAGERISEVEQTVSQGLRSLTEIASLLLIAAALAVGSALIASIWQRRGMLAALKIQGYDTAQLWRAVLLESAIVLGVGVVMGAAVGIYGHALACRELIRITGFPAPFSIDIREIAITLGLLA
ncbi:MAG TPA: FtsX-like permease family protein, partial [Solirubrobacteraceae bacterium]|nr:FtsX-like permease family protein [Solirubrobacteraceae bacterium]